MNGETIRYDKEEDRALDIKTHDNAAHPSDHANQVNLEETDNQLQEVEITGNPGNVTIA